MLYYDYPHVQDANSNGSKNAHLQLKFSAYLPIFVKRKCKVIFYCTFRTKIDRKCSAYFNLKLGL